MKRKKCGMQRRGACLPTISTNLLLIHVGRSSQQISYLFEQTSTDDWWSDQAQCSFKEAVLYQNGLFAWKFSNGLFSSSLCFCKKNWLILEDWLTSLHGLIKPQYVGKSATKSIDQKKKIILKAIKRLLSQKVC